MAISRKHSEIPPENAVHPNYAVRPVGCWVPKDLPVAVEQSSGRDRLNIHCAIALETGQTVMKDVLTVDALSTILRLMAIEVMYPAMRLIHVFLDNARYHRSAPRRHHWHRPGRPHSGARREINESVGVKTQG